MREQIQRLFQEYIENLKSIQLELKSLKNNKENKAEFEKNNPEFTLTFNDYILSIILQKSKENNKDMESVINESYYFKNQQRMTLEYMVANSQFSYRNILFNVCKLLDLDYEELAKKHNELNKPKNKFEEFLERKYKTINDDIKTSSDKLKQIIYDSENYYNNLVDKDKTLTTHLKNLDDTNDVFTCLAKELEKEVLDKETITHKIYNLKNIMMKKEMDINNTMVTRNEFSQVLGQKEELRLQKNIFLMLLIFQSVLSAVMFILRV